MIGLVLVAAGAILVWAVTADPSQVNLDAVGWILMGVGLVEFLVELIFFNSVWGRVTGRKGGWKWED